MDRTNPIVIRLATAAAIGGLAGMGVGLIGLFVVSGLGPIVFASTLTTMIIVAVVDAATEGRL